MRKNIWLDGMMGLVVGDALGSPAQFRPRSDFKENKITEMEYCRCFKMPAGSFTDDSSMALASLAALIDKKGYDLYAIADNFVKWLHHGEFTPTGSAYDVGVGCRVGIGNYLRTGDPYTAGGDDEYNNGNGSLMRILPVCLYAYELQKKICTSDNQVISMIHDASGITHRHLRSKMACGLYFFMIKAILDEKNKAELENRSMKSIKECLQAGINEGINYYKHDISNFTEIAYFKRLFDLNELSCAGDDTIKTSGYVIDTIEAVVYNLITTDSYEACEIQAINMGDDADTVGAIAGGLAGLYYGYDNIPKRWLNEIQRKEWIEDMCLRVMEG